MMTFIRRNGIWLAFLVLVIGATILTEGSFLSSRNLTNLMRQAAINGILAAGMTLVILTAGIDLSIGSLVALAGIAVGISQVHWGWSDHGALGAFGSVALAICVGAMAGFAGGGLIAKLKIVPFVITLGSMVVLRGLALIFSNGSSISPMGDALAPIAEGYLSLPLTGLAAVGVIALLGFQYRRNPWDGLLPGVVAAGVFYAFLAYKGFPVLVLFLALATGAMGLLLGHTSFGRAVYAIGSNERAAFWAGVPVDRVKWIVYGIMGMLSGLAGALLTSRLNGADPNAGQLFELDAIAAVVIGGTSLKGGEGSIMGSLVGALTIATLNNAMDLMGVNSFYQMVCKGLIIIVTVALDRGPRTQ